MKKKQEAVDPASPSSGAVRDAEEFGWEEGAAKLRPMVGGVD